MLSRKFLNFFFGRQKTKDVKYRDHQHIKMMQFSLRTVLFLIEWHHSISLCSFRAKLYKKMFSLQQKMLQNIAFDAIKFLWFLVYVWFPYWLLLTYIILKLIFSGVLIAFCSIFFFIYVRQTWQSNEDMHHALK